MREAIEMADHFDIAKAIVSFDKIQVLIQRRASFPHAAGNYKQWYKNAK